MKKFIVMITAVLLIVAIPALANKIPLTELLELYTPIESQGVPSGNSMLWNNGDTMLWNNGDTMLWN